ncbi:MAG: six-cysteine ranthipeptide SCIFF [Oscillospiraceae bacterium]|nr:six-cysteine ranthipeptide SCIFF [Oscillospiraceae bacterium]
MKHIKTLNKPDVKDAVRKNDCSSCRAVCRSACKTSCTVANHKCENRK